MGRLLISKEDRRLISLSNFTLRITPGWSGIEFIKKSSEGRLEFPKPASY